jgi:circadian clock protein KaiC
MQSLKAVIRRLATGVPGLDDVLGGGLPEFSFNLIAGPPGSGKTTLAHQLMFSLATPERPALYFTVLGEPPLKMLRYQQQFDFFDLDKLNRSIRIVNLADESALGDLSALQQRIVAEVESHAPGVVVVDSFRTLVPGEPGDGRTLAEMQRFIQNLGVLMASWQATTFLVGEYASENAPNPVFTVADGMIWLRQSVHGHSMVRQMEIVKMRGQATRPGLHAMRIGPAGVEVFAPPSLNDGDAPMPRFPERLAMGVPGLDEMIGGGLPRGHSLLVAGPSGSGKSLLAFAFLAEGERQGQPGVIAAFGQHPVRSCSAAMASLIASGRVGVVGTPANGLSVDEIAMLLLAEVRRLGARRVVIDSLSGLELALAPTFRADLREALARIVSALATENVSLLITCEPDEHGIDPYTGLHRCAFLADAVIVQRRVEVAGRLQRVMAVVKVRSSAHSNEMRPYSIDDDGLHLGPMPPGPA